MGRPSEHTPEVEAEILERLAMGETMRGICRDHDMPGLSTVYRWLEADAEFRQRYARAREVQAHGWADDVLEVANAATAETVQVAKLQVDALKWRASKGSPKHYGEKVALEHSTPPGQPMQVEHRATPETLAELANVLGEITGTGGAPT